MNSTSLPRLRKLSACAAIALAITMAATGPIHAQVPGDIESQLMKIGPIVDPTCTAKIYRPMMPKAEVADQYIEMQKMGKPSSQVPLYPGITIQRDISFGPDAKDVVDIFYADKGPKSRTVLIYVPGGAGNKIEIENKESNAFNDNILRWAAENGMVGVMIQRHGLPAGAPPDFYAGAKDISAMIQWVEKNIATYHGNPNRMFIWAHSAANGPLGIYAGHPELYGPQGVGVQGIVFMSGQFNILRADGTNPVPPAPPRVANAPTFGAAGSSCGGGGFNATDGALPGKAPGQPGGPNPPAPAGAAPAGRPPQVAQDELIKRSSLPALQKTTARIYLASAELDPGIVEAKPSAFNQALHDELCKQDGAKAKDGKGHCPLLLVMKGESHMSEPYSVDSGDKTVTTPLLAWIKSTK